MEAACLEINVLGVFQTTRRKSAGARLPEKSNGESFSRFSASVFGPRHEARPGR